MSTGAAREALLKLAAKNLVSSEAHHGFQVTDVTARGLADLTDARTEIESLTLSRAISEGDLAWQARCQRSQGQACDGAPDDQVHELGVNLFPGEPAAVEERPEQSGGHGVAVSS